MSDEPWDTLREAFAAGRFTEHRKDAIQDRYLVFEDGTTWFPDGRPDLPSASLGPAVLFGGTLVFGVASLVLFVDGHRWALPSLAPLALGIAALVGVLRRTHRADLEAERRLERGVFLIRDELILRDPPFDERMSHASIERFVVRRAHRGGEASRPWLHIERTGEDLDVPLDLTVLSRPELEAWLERER